MSITSALYTGITGLQVMGNSIQTTGNNIANVNTVGYKASRVDFSDLLSQTISLGGRSAQLGRGVQMEAISRSFAQGSFQNTDNITDLGISGRGFFVLSDGTERAYARAGNFLSDANGDLVSTSGLGLQGLLYDQTGAPTGTQGTINISNSISPPNLTTEVTISTNLDSGATGITTTGPGDIDPTDSATYNHSVSITVYDSLGESHRLQVYYQKDDSADGTWQWAAYADPTELEAGSSLWVGGTLEFTDVGALNTVSTPQTWDATTGFDFTNGAAVDQDIAFIFGDPIADLGTGFAGSTQYASNGVYVTNVLSQDGFESGSLETITIGSDGIITGIFSNGRARAIAQILLANFQNEQGLFSAGSNLFQETPSSGQPTIDTPGSGAAGEVVGNTLELSNVDLATEFVRMITDQRGFQANSRVITTGDEMLQEVVNLAR
jgi:flagellar hook protein FlgE